jgi:hypothetical protein
VELRRLDDVVSALRIPQPHFIKCDAEGAEYAVFRGAAAVLDRADAPIILYEADARSARAFGLDITCATRVLKDFSAAGYEIFWVRPSAMLRAIDVPGPECDHYNLIAVP